MNITIRLCTAIDKQQVIELWNEIFPPLKHHNQPDLSFDKKIQQKDNLFYIAEHNNTILGTIIAGYDGHRGWIYSLAVKPKYRRKGIGSQLITTATNELSKRGCLKVNLQITGDTSPYIAFYKKNGFNVEKRISMGKTLY